VQCDESDVLQQKQQQQHGDGPLSTAGDVTVTPKMAFVIDVMFEPGRLIDACSCEAIAYKTAHSWPSHTDTTTVPTQ